jgi:predicted DNA-binding helix-hairpin-helix protein
MKLYMQNIAEGIFLTSAVCGDADSTTKDMLKAVHLLRDKYHFMGYIHFKCLPGTSYYLLKEAVQVADRISVNVEAPTKAHLSEIACQKNYDTDILLRQRWLKEIRFKRNLEIRKINQDFQADHSEYAESQRDHYALKPSQKKGEWIDENGEARLSTGYLKGNWDGAPSMNSGQTTQFIVGAARESDYDILKRLDWEYREVDLRRGYFSAFSPIEGTPLERMKATPLDREHRLYQTDWLLRRYHIPMKELPAILTNEDNLPNGDPKIHLAKIYFEENGPVDINSANYDELLRVPGIGPLSAQRILRLRKQNEVIKSRAQLHHIGVVIKRADPFIKVNGTHQFSLDNFVKISYTTPDTEDYHGM